MEPKDNIKNLINEKEVQFRDFHSLKIETRQNEDGKDELVVEGVACTFNQETVLYKGKYYEDREKIDPNAFDECDMTDVIFNYNHCGRVYARTRNKSLELSIKEDGLHVKAVLMNDDEGHKELYRDIQSGLIDKMSFAFHVEESKWEYTENGEYTVYTRTVTKIDKLYDVSAVDIPAYDTTSISARSAFDAERERRNAESIRLAEELELQKRKLLLLLQLGKES
ncbi:MAG: HK97 family phage prohead protease [Bacteroidales bacterium]|nr:HK97 family phage prohead protease [Candidatus Scybalousia scybalohippi]